MKYKHILIFSFLLPLIVAKLFGQTTPYLLGEMPAVFQKIENKLLEEDLDTVFQLCSRLVEGEQNPLIKGIAYFYQGEAAALMNDFQSAAESFDNAIKIFKATDFKKGLAMAYCKNGDLYFYQSELFKADSMYDQSITLAEKVGLNEVLADAYQNKAMIYTDFQDAESAMDNSKKSLKVSYFLNDLNRIKNMLNQIATNYHSLGELDSAIVYFQKTIDLKNKNQDPEGLIGDYSALGNLYRQRGSYQQAQEQLIKGLKIAEIEKDTFSMMTLFSEIGDVYAAQEGWEKAEGHYRKSLDLARSKNRQFVEAGCLNKLGNIYHLQGKESAAIEKYELALKIYEQINSKINAADVQISLSKIYKEGNQLEKAKIYLLEALDARTQSADKLSILTVKMALAEIEIMTGNRKKGVELIKECLPEYEEMEDQEGLKNAYFLLSESYAKSNDYKLAFEYFQAYKNLSDSLLSIERTKAINELDLLYTTEKKDKEIAQQKAAIEKQQMAIEERNKRYLLLAALGSLILLSVTIGLLYSRKLNRQLTTKNSLIESQKVEIESERNRAEGLLLNVLPETVANELKQKGHATPEHYDSVTVLFTDFEGFTKIASSLSPTQVVNELNDCFLKFDEIAEKYNLEKIKTIGDAYMCAGGLPVRNKTHPLDAISAAKEMLAFVEKRNGKLAAEGKPIWPIRIGIHTGELVAGVVGSKKFAYDIWGDTVNVASRMESNAGAGQINISEATYKLAGDKFHCRFRGEIEVKNKGAMGMYIVDV